VGCIWKRHETQGFAVDHHDPILANTLGDREWPVRSKYLIIQVTQSPLLTGQSVESVKFWQFMLANL
jgi:hypothetical protein